MPRVAAEVHTSAAPAPPSKSPGPPPTASRGSAARSTVLSASGARKTPSQSGPPVAPSPASKLAPPSSFPAPAIHTTHRSFLHQPSSHRQSRPPVSLEPTKTPIARLVARQSRQKSVDGPEAGNLTSSAPRLTSMTSSVGTITVPSKGKASLRSTAEETTAVMPSLSGLSQPMPTWWGRQSSASSNSTAATLRPYAPFFASTSTPSELSPNRNCAVTVRAKPVPSTAASGLSSTSRDGHSLYPDLNHVAESQAEKIEKHLVDSDTNEQEKMFPFLSLEDYFWLRHGYKAKAAKTGGDLDKGLKLCTQRLLYFRNLDVTEIFHGVVDFCDTLDRLANDQAALDTPSLNLGPFWDISTDSLSNCRPSCTDSNLSLLTVETTGYHHQPFFCTLDSQHADIRKLYIIRPSKLDQNPSNYFIATADPTTVLFIFRNKAVVSINDAVVVLLKYLIPFRLVKEYPRGSTSGNNKQQLPKRLQPFVVPVNFKPTEQDYRNYLNKRKDVLDDVWGPAVRSLGGIAGRIAYDIVSEHRVLQGPQLCDEVIGWTSDREYAADHVPMEVFEAISGVYAESRIDMDARRTGRVKKEVPPKKASHWPKQDTWRKGGRDSDHWTPMTEGWYQQSSKKDGHTSNLWGNAEWKSKLKVNQKSLLTMLQMSRRLAETYLENEQSIQRWC